MTPPQSDVDGSRSAGASGRTHRLDALIAVLLAVPYAFALLGLQVVWPTNIDWLGGDAATYYIGWAAFRHGSALHWPITYTPALGYPIGESISLLDPVPIAAVLLRPFSALLPEPFQYLGLYAVLCLILQLYFGVRLIRRLSPDSHTATLWVFGLFFLTAPAMTRRFGGHFALASHWLILASLLLYARMTAGQADTRRTFWFSVVLSGVAVAVNPYLAFMVLTVLGGAFIASVWTRRMTFGAAFRQGATIVLTAGLVAAAFGFVGGVKEDFSAAGYRYFSMNIQAPIDPSPASSPVFPARKSHTAGQYEGYNYLGAGTVMLLCGGLFALVSRQLRINSGALARWAPAMIVAVGLALLAVSTLVTSGERIVVDLDPRERLTPYLAMFRASGRLFWVPYYLVMTFAVTAVSRSLRGRQALVVAVVALALQLWDTRSVREHVTMALAAHHPPQDLRSRLWEEIGSQHKNLMVLPPWQCQADTPGGADGFRIFGLMAARLHLNINSYYAARYHQESLRFHCKTAVDELLRTGFQRDTLYVLSGRVHALLSAELAKQCRYVDAFIVCSTIEQKENHKLAPLPSRVRGMTAEDSAYLRSGWTQIEPGFGAWSTGTEATLAYRGSSGSARSVRLTLLAITGKEPVQFRVVHGEGQFRGVLAATEKPVIQLFTIRVPVGSGQGEQILTLQTDAARAPSDQGYNADTRKLGLGLHTITADACAPSSQITLRTTDQPDPACEIK